MSKTSKNSNKKTWKDFFAQCLREGMVAFACSVGAVSGNYRPYNH